MKPENPPLPFVRVRRSQRWLVAVVCVAQLLSGCVISTPYRETIESERLLATPSAIVVVTEATLSPGDPARASFWRGVKSVQRALASQPGLMGYSLRRELFGNRVWTMTAWTSEADMRRFAISPAHREAIRIGTDATVDMRFAHVRPPAGTARITWEDAIDALARADPSDE